MGDVKSLAELLAEPPRRGDWGGWRLDPETCTLHLPRNPSQPEDGDQYWCDLRRCTTEQGVLFWLFQLESKSWITDRALAGLVRALGDLFAPQHSYTLTLDQVRGRVGDVATWLPPDESTARGSRAVGGQVPDEKRTSQEPTVAARLDGMYLLVDCPFCRQQHHHGAGDPEYPVFGSRVSHCHLGTYILVPEGG